MTASRSFAALGMTCEVVADEAVMDAATRIVERQLSELDQVCSSARADSELNRMARGRSVPVSQLLTDVLAAALRTAVRTDGLVDPTVGTPAPGYWRIVLDQAHRQALIPRGVEVDLGAVAGAWAADRAAWTCASRLAGAFLVNVGGNVAASGPTPTGGWQVAIDDGSSVLSTAGRGGWVQQGRPIVTIRHGALATASTRSRGFFRQPASVTRIRRQGTAYRSSGVPSPWSRRPPSSPTPRLPPPWCSASTPPSGWLDAACRPAAERPGGALLRR